MEEKVSLSDRFGLWLGFHRCSQDEYLAMVEGYVDHYKLPVNGGDALRLAEGNVAKAADLLQVPRKTLYDKLQRLGVSAGDFVATPAQAGRP